MNALILFDSQYGNTKKIAQSMSRALSVSAVVTEKSIAEATLADIQKSDLLIIGSPTQGGRPTKALQAFLDSLPPTLLANKKIAAFDTRFHEEKQKLWLRLLMKIIGYAAPKLISFFQLRGGTPVMPPEGFFVNGTSGPLPSSELKRAAEWARKVLTEAAKK